MMRMGATCAGCEPALAQPRSLAETAVRGAATAPSGECVHGALGCPSLDELAQQDICAALLSTPGLDARQIEVEMTGAGVLLRGKVARPEDRGWALRIARRIAAPRSVREELALASSSEVDALPRHASHKSEPADAEGSTETARRLLGDTHVACR